MPEYRVTLTKGVMIEMFVDADNATDAAVDAFAEAAELTVGDCFDEGNVIHELPFWRVHGVELAPTDEPVVSTVALVDDTVVYFPTAA